MNSDPATFKDLNDRSRAVFRKIVESYLETGDPMGSRTLSKSLSENVSPATIRNTMQDLEHLGLLAAPHISSGRIPTQLGLRLFVDGFLEVGAIDGAERREIERVLDGEDQDMGQMLDQAGALLSGLTRGASLVLAPKQDTPIRHIEFVSLSPDRALVVLVTADGQVENRIFTPPPGLTPSAMREAANFLNAALEGRSLTDLRGIVSQEIATRRQEIDSLSANLIEAGIAVWSGTDTAESEARLIVRGQANLIDDTISEEDLERIRLLFEELERKRDLVQLLDLAQTGEGVRIFIGSENKLFSLSGSSLVVAPYMNTERRIIGAVGVIGPTRQNYGRIVPIVDYTAQLVGRLIADHRTG